MITAYLRESTNMQDIDTQRRLIQEHCAKRGVPFEEFADDGFSGTIPFNRRPAARKLLEAVSGGRAQEVICYRIDRLGRDHADTYATIAELLKRGVKVTSLKEGTVENTPSGRFVTGIHSLVASYERDVFLDRSIDAIRELVKKGAWTGGALRFGYCRSGAGKQARLAPAAQQSIPGLGLSEVDVIKRIYRDAADGKSCVKIADALNRLGVATVYARDGRTVRGKSTAGIWTSTRVRNLIIDPLHKGVYVWGKRKFVRDPNDHNRRHLTMNHKDQWIEVQRPDLAIVDDKLWQNANNALHRNQISAMAHSKNCYLLRSLIRCTCGLVYYAATPRGVTYYMHSRKSPRERCTATALRGDILEAAVWGDLEGFLKGPGKVIRLLEQQMRADSSKDRKVADERRELAAARTRKAEAHKRLLTLFTEGVIERAEFTRERERLAAALSEIDQRLAELAQLAAEQDTNALALSKARSALEALRDKAHGNLSFDTKRQIVEALVEGIIVTPAENGQPKVRIQYRFDPDTQRYVNQWAQHEDERLALNYMHS